MAKVGTRKRHTQIDLEREVARLITRLDALGDAVKAHEARLDRMEGQVLRQMQIIGENLELLSVE